MASLSQDLRQGLALHQAGKLGEARRSYERMLQRAPEDASVLHLLALVDLTEGRAEDSVGRLRRCLALRPRFPEALTNLGRALLAQNRPVEALAAHEDALALNPRLAEAHGNLGNTLKFLHRTEEAIAAYRRAQALWPDSADLRYNEALVHLLRGDLARGWKDYERRWDRKRGPGRRPFSQPAWRGEGALAGKSILIHAEQGLGDTLQFVRYLPLLAAQGAAVHLEAQPSLRALLTGQLGALSVRTRLEPPPATDLHCPLLSLPGAFATELDSIPSADRPYLRAPAERAAEWRRRLAPAGSPRIGLAWSGNPTHQNDRHRSIPLEGFREIVRGGPGSFVSLQKDVRPDDAAVLAQLPELLDLAPQLHDLAETAAVAVNLDLIITVDTALAHLAGALGVRTWLLLPYAPDWRWLLERSDSPWYSSLRLFRQPAPGDWTSVLDRIRDELPRAGLAPAP